MSPSASRSCKPQAAADKQPLKVGFETNTAMPSSKAFPSKATPYRDLPPKCTWHMFKCTRPGEKRWENHDLNLSLENPMFRHTQLDLTE